MGNRLRMAGAWVALASALLTAPTAALALTVSTSYSSLDEMPPMIRSIFIGVFILVPTVVIVAVVLSVRKSRADKKMVEQALGDARDIIDSAGGQGGQGGPTIIVGGTPVAPAAGGTPDLFAGIRAVDPTFSEALFEARANQMFMAIQYAWVDRDLTPVRRFMSDDKYRTSNEMLQRELIAKGLINHRDLMQVTRMTPISVSRQGDFDSIVMDICGLTNYYMTDEKTGRVVQPQMFGDGKTRRPFHEQWTFVRKAGVRSKPEATILSCPNCLAPVTDGAGETCAYCGARLNDPALDWVLAGTEQFAQ